MSQEISVGELAPGAESVPAGVWAQGLRAALVCHWPVVVMLLYFGLRLLFFAIGIAPQVPPDEVTHFGKSQVFSRVLLLPDNSPASFEFGLVTNTPWLYYWIMGKLLPLNIFGISDLVFLRLCNIPLVFGTIWYAWRMLRLLTVDRLASVLMVIMLTNTIMFSFLSASVSYDNLVNLWATMALYYLFAFFKERLGHQLAASLLCMLAGCLTKITFLPLVLILGLLLVIHESTRIKTVWGELVRYLQTLGGGGRLLVLGIAVAGLLNLQLYGGNYLKYGSIDVETYDVLPVEQAMQYRLAARNYIFLQFKDGHITREQAIEMASAVKHPGDRQDTVSLVENYATLKESGQPLLGFLPYAAIWVLHMLESTFGIKAHLGMSNHGPAFIPMMLVILASMVAFGMRWRPREAQWLPTCMAFVVLCYAFILMYSVNYSTYQVFKDIILSVAGRYMFPVIAPMYVLASVYLMRLSRSEKARLAVLALAGGAFIAADFPFFLSKVTPEWFSW